MENTVCANCENEVLDDLDFCPYCGTLFIEDVKCINHTDKKAKGVCLICEEPYCNDCGKFVAKKFLCSTHAHYEIYEGMAKVFGSNDHVHCNYLANMLKQETIHALVYMRKTSPISVGGVDYSLFRASGEYNDHLINEIKVMVPFHQVLEAEKIINEFEKGEEEPGLNNNE